MRISMALILITFIGCFMSFSCKKMDSNYKKFVVPGGIIYPGKATDVKAYGGHNRARLTYVNSLDPDIAQTVIFWNNNQDSAVIKNNGIKGDTISYVIEGLGEGSVTFTIKSYYADGKVSMPQSIVCDVYGDAYLSALQGRPMLSIKQIGTDIKIKWGNVHTGCLGTILKYKNTNNIDDSVYIPNDSMNTVLEDMLIGDSMTVSHYSIYIPDSSVIDTFQSAVIKKTFVKEFVEEKVPSSLISILELPGDQANDAVYGSTYGAHLLFDDNINSGSQYYNEGAVPKWFTVDLHAKVKLSRFKVWQRTTTFAYALFAPKTYEVWGSNDPDTDGGWDNWQLLGHFDATIPSGLPYNQATVEDKNYAVNDGVESIFTQPQPAFRYLRFKMISSFDGNNTISFMELSFWGEIQ